MKNFARLIAGARLVVAVLVALACLFCLYWLFGGRQVIAAALQRALSSSAASAQAMRQHIEMATNRIDSMDKYLQETRQDLARYAAAADETGALFPESRDLLLVSSVHAVRDITHNLRPMMSAQRDLLLALNSLPRIALNTPTANQWEALDQRVDELWTAVNDLKAAAAGLRDGDGAAASQAAARIVEIDRLRSEIRAELIKTDRMLAAQQSQVANLKTIVPRYLNYAAIVAVVLLLWGVYSQWELARLAWRELRKKIR